MKEGTEVCVVKPIRASTECHPELVSGSVGGTRGRSKTVPTKKQPVVKTTNKSFGENPNIGSDGETRPTLKKERQNVPPIGEAF